MSTTDHIEFENMKNHLETQIKFAPEIENTINYSEMSKEEKAKNLEKIQKDHSLLIDLETPTKYKPRVDDLMKSQEFLPENIQPEYEEIKNKDFFEFSDENDKKYDFFKAKYLLRSKTMLKAFYWSVGIGFSMFCHRYYRKQNLKKSIYIGTATMGISFIVVWGNFELNPFMTSFYFSKYIENMSRSDYEKSTYYNYIKYQSENLDLINNDKKNNFKGINFTLSIDPCDEIAKYFLELDNKILINLNSQYKNKIDSVIKKIEHNEEDDEDEEFDEKKNHFENNKGFIKKDYEYDFSEYNKNSAEGVCKIDIPIFFEFEENSTGGLSLVKTSILNDNKIITNKQETLKMLKYQLGVTDYYLKGFYDNLELDPDYKANETIKF